MGQLPFLEVRAKEELNWGWLPVDLTEELAVAGVVSTTGTVLGVHFVLGPASQPARAIRVKARSDVPVFIRETIARPGRCGAVPVPSELTDVFAFSAE